MKIKKLKKISNIGNYNNFIWNENTREFAKYNFLYGWNYSGKTTLSRIFSFLESGSIPDDFKDVQFSFETDKGTINQWGLKKNYPVRVYNEDFVENNFQWRDDNAKIEPVLILGKKSKELNEKLNEITHNLQEKVKDKNNFEQEIKKIEQNLSQSLTDKASEIRNILGITNAKEFDKNGLREIITSIKDTFDDYILSKEKLTENLEIYRSKKVDKITFQLPELKLSDYITNIENILSRKVTAKQIIEKLKNDPKLANWVKEGISFHYNETHCQFCGNLLPDDLLDKLNKHFSEEFDDLIREIDNIIEQISTHIKEIEDFKLPDKAYLFEDLKDEYQNITTEVNDSKEKYINSLITLISELNIKREKPFDALKFQSRVNNVQDDFSRLLQEMKNLIKQHNAKVDNFENIKLKAKISLIKHYTAEFIKKKDYLKNSEEKDNKKNEIINLKNEINKLEQDIKEINKQIKAEAIGAEKINQYLTQFFADDRLKVQLIEEGKYKLYRNNQIAKNLSTGEKNIISLIYFFAKLEEKNFNFKDGVIFIDDPVSSLDSNHIFKVYGFICEKLKECGQLFITTHNFDFFNLLKDASRYDFKNNGNFYLIKKIKTGNVESTIIDKIPAVLLKFKSEYNYLFSILKSFNESTDKSKFELLYILPNILRRFFEAYLFMKYPDGKKFKEKANNFLTDCENKKVVLKLMDEYSHEEDPTHSQKFPDIQEVEQAVHIILNELKKKDSEHFSALNDSLS